MKKKKWSIEKEDGVTPEGRLPEMGYADTVQKRRQKERTGKKGRQRKRKKEKKICKGQKKQKKGENSFHRIRRCVCKKLK